MIQKNKEKNKEQIKNNVLGDLKEYFEKVVGKEYTQALSNILDTRAERRLIYQDSFLQEKVVDLLQVIDGKRRRFDKLFATKNISKEIKFKKYDEILDIINYYMFILTILDKKEKKK